jgi:hypothetical protein
VDRDLRAEYIGTLEKADRGDLSPVAQLSARLERGAILQALSIDVDSEVRAEQTLTAAVIENLAEKFSRRRTQKLESLRKVNELAAELRSLSRLTIHDVFTKLLVSVTNLRTPDIHFADGGPDHNNSRWYKFDVIKSGEQSGKFISFDENHYFEKGTFKLEGERLVFVVSMHDVGRELSGIMEVTAFAQLESYEDSDDRKYVSQDFSPCSLDPFVITWRTSLDDVVEKAFVRWLDAALAVAIKEYGDRI